jgi:hypothetical protein
MKRMKENKKGEKDDRIVWRNQMRFYFSYSLTLVFKDEVKGKVVDLGEGEGKKNKKSRMDDDDGEKARYLL